MYHYFFIYSSYDKLHFLYAGGSHVSTLDDVYDCHLDKVNWFYKISFVKSVSEDDNLVLKTAIFNGQFWLPNKNLVMCKNSIDYLS